MKLWLHIGTPKTGTTSIQRALADNRDLLKRNGLLYPDLRPFLGGGDLNHQRLVKDLTGRDLERRALAAKFMLSVRAETASATLLSGEGFYLRAPGGDKWTRLARADYWEQRREYINGIAQSLQDFDVEILLVLREKTSFAASLWGQVVLGNGWAGHLEEFIKLIQPLLDYESQIDIWRNSFGKVRVLSFEQLVANGKLAERFLGAIEFTLPLAVTEAWERRSPSRPTLEWLRSINAAKPPAAILIAARNFAVSEEARTATDVDAAFRYSLTHNEIPMPYRVWLQVHRLRNRILR